MKEKDWLLQVGGFNETFGLDGFPDGSIDYEFELYFETLDEALKFIKNFQDAAVQYHKYKIELI